MEVVVYILCALTSLACAVLLLRSYAAGRVRLLLWSGLCFVGFAMNNILLFIDMNMLPDTDLSIVRSVPALIGLLLLVYGLIWDTK